MGLRERVMEMLVQGRDVELAAFVAGNRRALRPVMARLWDANGDVRATAARAIGRVASADRVLGLELARRLVWGLNDESATNGVYGLPAIGEIGRHAPDLIEPFVPALVSMAWDDGLRLEILKALRVIATTSPHLVVPHLSRLESHVSAERPDERSAFEELSIVARESES